MKLNILAIMSILLCAISVSADDQNTKYVVSTGKDWESHLVFVQYGKIGKIENNKTKNITLTGDSPSSAIVLGIKCIALADQEVEPNTTVGVTSIPSVFVDNEKLSSFAVSVEKKKSGNEPVFTEMEVYTLFGKGTDLCFSGLGAKKGQNISMLIAYKLSTGNITALKQSKTITIDYINGKEVSLPAYWFSAPKKGK
jgi:hypothetical protein